MTATPAFRSSSPWQRAALLVAALASWGIAPFEHLPQAPANRIGYDAGVSLAQPKITREALTPVVFVPFSMLCMKQPFRLDCLWAGLRLVGAAYFIFRGA